MNTFPCRECLVRPSCSEYCPQLETNRRILTLYINSNQCPDCGSKDQFLKSNNILVICPVCIRAFEREVTVKGNIHYLPKLRPPPTLVANKPGTIIPLVVHKYPPVSNLSMEETHDILYERMSISMTKHVIHLFTKEISRIVQTPLKPDKQDVGLPSWIDDYPTLFSDENEGKQPNQIII